MKVSLMEPSLLKNGPNPGVQPDFQIFTSAMEVDSERENIVRMIGSSTERDLHGDTMALSALTDMAQVEPGMAIWLNHRYSLPDSLFGSLQEKPELRLQGGIADLHIVSDVTALNPDAVRTYGYVKEGRKLGCSIGCMILEYEVDEENDDGSSWWPPIIILRVQPLEWSVVGIPANQRSWVENGIKGLFERSLSQGRGDEALKLAPAMRGLYPRAFQDKLKEMNNEGLRKDLEKARPRAMPDQRIEWDTPRKTFFLSQSLQRGERKTMDLERSAVSDFLAKQRDPMQVAAKALFAEKAMIGWDPAGETGSAVLAKIAANGDVLEVKSLDLDDAPAEEDTAGEGIEIKSVSPVPVPVEEVDPASIAASEEIAAVQRILDVEAEIDAKKEISIEQASERLLSFSTDEDHTIKLAPVNDVEVQMYNLLAAKFGRPQITLDGNGEIVADKAESTPPLDVVQEIIKQFAGIVETVKAGNKLSKSNRESVQLCHDTLVKMAGTQWVPCDGLDGGDEEEEGTEESKQFSAVLNAHSEIPVLREEFKALIDTLKAQGHFFDPKAFKDLQVKIDAAQRQYKEIEARAKATEERVGRLANVPLGQPTLLNRGFQSDEGVVTYQDLTQLASKSLPMNDNERRWTLEDALEQTTLVPKKVGDKDMLYRLWPDSVGGSVKDGVRPELTNTQRIFMHPSESTNYARGGEAAVPCYDDPGGQTM